MNWDQAKGQWKQLKGKALEQWRSSWKKDWFN